MEPILFSKLVGRSLRVLRLSILAAAGLCVLLDTSTLCAAESAAKPGTAAKEPDASPASDAEAAVPSGEDEDGATIDSPEDADSAGAIEEPAAGEPEFSNWVGFTLGGAFVRGDETAMMRRTRTNGSDVWGGIDSMQLIEEIDDTATLTFNGHALPGLHDYEFNVDLQDYDWGFIKAGYKQFRTWYDATGGYLEGANVNLNGINGQMLFDDGRHIDRGEVYFQAGLRVEDVPEVTFSYRHLFRDGQKDSTSWGDTIASPNFGGVAGFNPQFKLLSALWNINETVDVFELGVEHALGKTDVGMGFVYENYDLENSRETPRWTTAKAPKTPPNSAGLSRITLTEKTHAEIFSSNVHSVTRFNDRIWLSYAAAYSSMDTDIDGGSRRYDVYWTAPPVQGRDYAYDQMTGGGTVKQFVTNVNLMTVPFKDLTVTPSFRFENENEDMVSFFRAFNTGSSPTVTWKGLQALGNNTDADSYTGALDIRYSGFEDVVLYAKAQLGREDEDILWQDRYLARELLTSGIGIDENEYSIGANWYARRNLSFSIQGLHSNRDQTIGHLQGDQPDATNAPGGANNLRPIMTEHDTEVDDLNFRVTYRPVVGVSLVTRYDYVHTEYNNQGMNWSAPAVAIIYPLIESGDIFSHVVSQSITWTPLERLYFQGTASWVSSETDTPEDRYSGVSHNDYLAGTLSVGYAIDKLTDITASYSYYGAGNYLNSQSFTGVDTMGYGLNTEEHSVNVALTRLIAPNKLWNLRYGFITSNTDPSSDQFGGYNDFDAHMLSTGLLIRF